MLFAVTVVMASVATTVPRAVSGFLTAGLQYDAAQKSSVSRDIVSERDGQLVFGPGAHSHDDMSANADRAWGAFDEALTGLKSSLPDPLRPTLSRADYAVVTKPAPSQPYGKVQADVGIGYDPRFLSRISFTAGHAPAPAPPSLPSDDPVEVVASSSVAETLQWDLGGTRRLSLPDRGAQDVTLVGIFEANDPAAPFWEHITAVLEPTVLSTPPSINATVFADAGGVKAAVSSVLTTRSTVWFSVSPGALAAESAAEVAQQVRKLVSGSKPVSATTSLVFQSGLPGVLEDAQKRNTSSQAILATILAGPVGLAVTIEILVARLLAGRLRPSVTLLAARGASLRQRRLLLAGPTLAIGIAGTTLAVAGWSVLPGGRLGAAGGVALVAVAILPAVFLVFLGAGTGSEPERVASSSTIARRLRPALEGLIVLAAVAALVALSQQDLDMSTTGALNLLPAATPLLLSLLGCVIVLRLFPPLLNRAFISSRRGRGIAPMLGIARAMRAGTAGLVPVVAILIATSVAVFSGVLSSTLAVGLADASRSRVGADISVDTVRLDNTQVEAIRDIPGVRAVAAVSIDLFHYLVPQDGKPVTVTAILVDPAEFAQVQASSPGALDLPPELSGSSAEAVPLVASDTARKRMFGALDAQLDRNAVRIVGGSPSAPFFHTSPAWVLIDRANADGVTFPEPQIADEVLVRLEPAASLDAVQSRIRSIAGASAQLETPADAATAQAKNPAVGGVRASAIIAIGGAAASGLIALALSAALDSRSRRQSFTLLAALGLGRKQSRASVAWEFAPLSAVGLVGGVLLGVDLSAVVLTTVDLRPFTAGAAQPGVQFDVGFLTLVAAGAAALVIIVTTASAYFAVSRDDLSRKAKG